MSPNLSFLMYTLTLLSSTLSAASNPFLDFCIPDPGPNPIQLTHLHTYPCKPTSNLTTDDFVFSGIRNPSPALFPSGFFGTFVTSPLFPALHTLGVSFARADFIPGGFNPPHYHPRATETAFVVRGTVYFGFVDSGGRLFASVLQEGDVVVNPRGMVHFSMNVGKETATLLGLFNGENPGTVNLPQTVFGSGIRDELLERAFEMSEEEVERLKKRFGSSNWVECCVSRDDFFLSSQAVRHLAYSLDRGLSQAN